MVTKRHVASEWEFADAVRRERKRCDRSDGSLLLLLLSSSDTTDASLHGIAGHWSEQVRETDYVGWQDEAHVLGVLVTDLRRSERELAAASVKKRMNKL